LSIANVKHQILDKIESLWHEGDIKFRMMFNTFATQRFRGKPEEYCKYMHGTRVWASYLEIYVCCLQFNMNILTFTVRENAFESTRSKMFEMFGISMIPRFDFHVGHVLSRNMQASLDETRLNHFVS